MKTNLILLALCIVLAPFTFGQLLFGASNFTDIKSIERLFDGFNEDRAALVVVNKPKGGATPVDPLAAPDKANPDKPVEYDQIGFIRENNEWVLASGMTKGVKIRQTEVKNRILDLLGKIRRHKSNVVRMGAKDEELKEWKLDDAQAIQVVIKDPNGTVIAHLKLGAEAATVLGKGREYGDQVRGTLCMKVDEKKSSKDVFLSEDSWYLQTEEDTWIDKRVLNLDQAKIKGLELKNPKGRFVWERGDDKVWKAKEKPEGAGEIKEFEKNNVLARAAMVDASKYVEPLNPALFKAYGLDPAEIEVKLTTEDAKVHTIKIGKKVPDKADYYAAIDGVNFLLHMAEYSVTPFEKDPKDFFEVAPAGQPASQPTSEPASKPSNK
jgi:hypothetical protein